MYSFDVLNVFSSRAYASMTYTVYRTLLQSVGPSSDAVAIGVRSGGRAVGLALARTLGEHSEVLSLYVDPELRCRGLGTSLLLEIESELAKRGCVLAASVYSTEKNVAALERVLQKCGWDAGRPRGTICRISSEICRASWLQKVRRPPQFEVFPWSELTSHDRENIIRRHAAGRRVPDTLVPFQYERNLESINSLGLRFRDEVIGWLITHRIAPDTIRYTALFVDEEFQSTGRALILLSEAIRLQIDALGRDSCGTFSVYEDNTAMKRFVERRLRPYLISRLEFRETRKDMGRQQDLSGRARTSRAVVCRPVGT